MTKTDLQRALSAQLLVSERLRSRVSELEGLVVMRRLECERSERDALSMLDRAALRATELVAGG